MSWISSGYRRLRGVCAAVFVLSTVAMPGGQAVAQRKATNDDPAKVVRVAAASDMEPVLQVLGPYFERQSGLKLKVSFGSSSALSQQLQNGAPADIFLSADFSYAEQLVASNLTETKSPMPYAKGVLVLWARKDSPFKPLDLAVLQRKDLRSVAIANPLHAPYGLAAQTALKNMNYMANVQPHLVEAESVAQAAQFALSGNAQLALISQTIAMSPKYRAAGTFVLFPFSQYSEIRQCAVFLKSAKNAEGAHMFFKFLTSNQVQGNLNKLGLQPVQ